MDVPLVSLWHITFIYLGLTTRDEFCEKVIKSEEYNKEQISAALKIFIKADTDNDDMLDVKEFKEAMSKYGLAEHEIEEMFDEMDTNVDEKISRKGRLLLFLIVDSYRDKYISCMGVQVKTEYTLYMFYIDVHTLIN